MTNNLPSPKLKAKKPANWGNRLFDPILDLEAVAEIEENKNNLFADDTKNHQTTLTLFAQIDAYQADPTTRTYP